MQAQQGARSAIHLLAEEGTSHGGCSMSVLDHHMRWLSARCSCACRSEIENMMAILVRGDAMSKEDIAKAFEQIEEVDAVVSTIGGTPADPMADSQVLLCSHLSCSALLLKACRASTEFFPYLLSGSEQ